MKVDVVRLGINGEGIFYVPEGEDKDKIGFVDFVLPSESADVEIVESKSRFCKAHLNSLTCESLHRVSPACPYFGECGGCDLQHMDKPLQIEFKKKLIFDVVKDFGYSDDIQIICGDEYNYRNKMVFPFDTSGDKILIGMFKKNSHDVVCIDKCKIAKDGINKVLGFCQKYFDDNFELFKKQKQYLKYLVVREVCNQFLITVVCSSRVDLQDFCSKIVSQFDVAGVSEIISDNSDEILSGKMTVLAGRNLIELNEMGIDYKIDNLSFLQVNDVVKTKLYKAILDYVNGDVIDAYSGAGLLSGIVAKNNHKVVGIEINKNASQCAEQLKKKNNLKSLTNICGDTGIYLPKVSEDFENYTLILDPARSGCGKNVLSFLKNENCNLPNRIIYVSCNLATLKRDLGQILQNYKILQVRGFEMFEQTRHIETLVVMDKR